MMLIMMLFAITFAIMCLEPSMALSFSSSKQGRGGGGGRPPLPLPNKSHTPLDIVNFQLSALQDDDMYTVFKYASPSNKAATGPWQRFSNMVRQEPYGILVGHDRAEVLLEWKESPPSRQLGSSYKCVVRVWSSSFSTDAKKVGVVDSSSDDISIGSKASSRNSAVVCKEFYWTLSEQNEAGDPLFAGCWMVDGVYPR